MFQLDLKRGQVILVNLTYLLYQENFDLKDLYRVNGVKATMVFTIKPSLISDPLLILHSYILMD